MKKTNSKGERLCKNSLCVIYFRQYNSLQTYCSLKCKLQDQKNSKKAKKRYRINPISKKRSKEQKIYAAKRIVFLAKKENQVCVIEGCNKKATTIEHLIGRIGKNYLDETFWRPCCLKHNLELENNPELSKKYQLSKIHGGKKI